MGTHGVLVTRLETTSLLLHYNCTRFKAFFFFFAKEELRSKSTVDGSGRFGGLKKLACPGSLSPNQMTVPTTPQWPWQVD